MKAVPPLDRSKHFCRVSSSASNRMVVPLEGNKEEDDGTPARRRMTVPSQWKPGPRRIQVSPLVQEIDEGFYENRKNSRCLPDFLPHPIYFPKLYLNTSSAPISYSSPEINSITDLYTLDMEISGEKRSGNQDSITNSDETFQKSRPVKSHPDSFFMSMRYPLLIFQIFGLLPVSGLSGPNHEHITFKWKHWKMAYVFFVLFGVLFLCLFSLILCIRDGFTYSNSAPVVFYASGGLFIWLFVRLAEHWRDLNHRFAQTEQICSSYGLPAHQARNFLIITIVFIVFALVEHVLSKFVDLMKAMPCGKEVKNVDNILHTFFTNQYVQVFSVVNYHAIWGFSAIFVNFICTACWNFTDLFLGFMGMALSSRLKQINKHLASIHGEQKSSSYWRKVREEYNSLSVLTKHVDQEIQKIMLLSLGDNLFFICLQLLKSLKNQINPYQVLYFFWSFGFLIIRTCFVTLCASGVFDESRESKTVLYSVPHESFCHEVRRFLMQLSTDELALTGCRFFSVTRGLILTIAGTVVTYEIVLVQFKTDTDNDDWHIVELTEEQHDSFFNTIRPAMRLAQWMALFPSLHGLNGPSPKYVVYSWRSWRTVYSIYSLLGNILIFICAVERFVAEGLCFDDFAGAYFYFSTFFTSLLLARVGKVWRPLCEEFGHMEIMFLRHGFPKLGLRFKIVLITFMTSAAVEHFSGIIQTIAKALPCVTHPGDPYSTLEAFFLNNYSKVFTIFEFQFWMGFILFHWNILFTFCWNFSDVFLLFLTMTINARFGQLNDFLFQHRYQACSSLFWRRARGEFNCLARLTRSVNSAVGGIIALSVMSNILFICIQLLRSLRPLSNAFQKFYFIWSFGFLLLRTLFAYLSMAEIQNRGKQFISVLFCVPSDSYGAEVERFLLQVEIDDVSLSGCGLFAVTRKTLLTIAGTILTYEIVLLQFNTYIGFDSWSTQSNKTYCFNT